MSNGDPNTDTNGYLLDTSFLIHLDHEVPEAIDLHNRIKGSEYVSTLALYELHKWSDYDPDPLIGDNPILRFNRSDAEAAGSIWRSLKSKGKPIGEIDTILGGMALSRNLAVVTDNIKHFNRIEGLSVEEY